MGTHTDLIERELDLLMEQGVTFYERDLITDRQKPNYSNPRPRLRASLTRIQQETERRVREEIVKVMVKYGNQTLAGNTIKTKCPTCKDVVTAKDSDTTWNETALYTHLITNLTTPNHE